MIKNKCYGRITALVLVFAMLFGLSSQASAGEIGSTNSQTKDEFYIPDDESVSLLKDGSAYVIV